MTPSSSTQYVYTYAAPAGASMATSNAYDTYTAVVAVVDGSSKTYTSNTASFKVAGWNVPPPPTEDSKR
jgi:hypothetical protein